MYNKKVQLKLDASLICLIKVGGKLIEWVIGFHPFPWMRKHSLVNSRDHLQPCLTDGPQWLSWLELEFQGRGFESHLGLFFSFTYIYISDINFIDLFSYQWTLHAMGTACTIKKPLGQAHTGADLRFGGLIIQPLEWSFYRMYGEWRANIVNSYSYIITDHCL